MKKYLVPLALLLLLLNVMCSRSTRLNRALEFAGTNRGELEKVLEYYRGAEADPLKLKAAIFLIENMPSYYSYKEHELIDTMKSLKAASKSRLADDVVENWSHVRYQDVPKVYDAHVIRAEFLIDNIEQSFDIWSSTPWQRHYTFDEFCEYILPYRVKDEPLEEWKTRYRSKYKPFLDSVYAGSDVVEAARLVANRLKAEGFYNQGDWQLPHLGASYLFSHRVGTCREACDIALYTMRSLGIPVAVDEYITSPSYSGKHFWTAVIDSTKRAVPFVYNEFEISRTRFDDRDKGKVYRTYFGAQPEKIQGIYQNPNAPMLFRTPFLRDVSEDYFSNRMSVDLEKIEKDQPVYLAVFRPEGWHPIDIASHQDKKVLFKGVEPALIYQTVFSMDGYTMLDTGYPFQFSDETVTHFVPDTMDLTRVDIGRKYPVTSTLKRHLATAIDVCIYGANEADLSDATLLYQVGDTLTTIYNTVLLDDSPKYRYVIYAAPDSAKIELAEFWCYADDIDNTPYEPVAIVGTPELTGIHQEITDLIIDDDFLSYYMSANLGEKLIFDLGSSLPIGRIAFASRNDDNFVVVGNDYELLYHGGTNGWISLGRQRAMEPRLKYDGVPSGALLWLRHLSGGKEEQVFYYEDGKQIFAYDL